MAILRCPQCGTLNRDDAVDFPLCRNCHERLIQCGYCRRFQRTDPRGGGRCDSKGAGGPRPVRAEEAPECRYFRPRYVAGGRAGQRVRIHPAAWILGIVAVILVALFTLSTMVRPAATPVERADAVDLRAEVPDAVRAGSDVSIDLTARNLAPTATGALRLEIPADFAERFALKSVDPSPLEQGTSRGQKWFLYPSLRRGEWLRVRLRVTAPRPGDYELRARLVGAGTQPPVEIRAPIRVVAG